MIASFHIVEYRKPVLLPPRQLAEQVRGLRFWRPLNIGGDFGWFRAHPGRWGLYRRLKPAFRHWAFYAVWEDDTVLDDFLATSPTGRHWAEDNREICHFWLRPGHARGTWRGADLLRDSASTEQHAGPTAHIVRLDLTLRGALAFWGSAAPSLLHHLPASNDLLLGLPLVDRPYMQPVSFSVWRAAENATTFAYHEGGHRDAVARVRRSQQDLLDRYSTASFQPYRCEGTWNGANPLSTIQPNTTEQPVAHS